MYVYVFINTRWECNTEQSESRSKETLESLKSLEKMALARVAQKFLSNDYGKIRQMEYWVNNVRTLVLKAQGENTETVICQTVFSIDYMKPKKYI